MTVKIAKVSRVNGKVTRIEAAIGDIEVHYVMLQGKPTEALRMRHGVQVLDRETLHIPPGDFRNLIRQVRTIFHEKPRSKPIQGQLFTSTDLH